MSRSHVFISYSRQDKAFVDQLISDLQAAGLPVWIDKQGLKVGAPDWEQAIRDAIRSAFVVLLIASPDSRESRYVRDELQIAEMYKCPVVAMWASGEHWPDSIRMGLMGTQYADAREKNYQKALLETIAALNNLASSPVISTPSSLSTPLPDFEPRNPYKGLRAFTGKDRGDFFGRDKLITELVEALKESTDTNRFLAIIGPSGSGKSSVIMAGLLPRLQENALPGSKNWVYLDPILPGSQPLESLAIILADALKLSITDVQKDLDASSRGLHLLARRLVKERESRLVLLVDQFEELFTQTTDADQRNHFIDLLVTAATEPAGQTIVLVTLRADFYDRPMNFPELGKLLEKRSKSVLPMDVEDLREVIEKPAALPDVQLQFEGGLVGDLLFEVRGEVSALPLLQFTLDQLVEKRNRRLLTISIYKELGGVRGALARHAEMTYQNLPSAEHKELTRALFLRLIEPGNTQQETTRRRTPQNELITADENTTRIFEQLKHQFTDARLLTIAIMAGITTIEISHETLIREWERLSIWVRKMYDDVRLQHIISRDTQEWLKRDKALDYLYRGVRLQEASDWTKRNPVSLEENDFIQAAIDYEYRLQQDEILNPPDRTLARAGAIRNLIFRSIRALNKDRFDEDIWKPFETLFEGIGKHELTLFYQDYVALKTGQFTSSRKMYLYLSDLLKHAPSDSYILEVIQDMYRYAKLYLQITGMDDAEHSSVSYIFNQFRQLRIPQIHPLLLSLFDRYMDNQFSANEFTIILKALQSFVIRRGILRVPNTRYRELFSSAITIQSTNDLISYLAYRDRDGWPEDHSIIDQLSKSPIYYHFPYGTRVMLWELERLINPNNLLEIERANVVRILVTEDNFDWREHLDITRTSIFYNSNSIKDTLGNLTLLEDSLNKRYSVSTFITQNEALSKSNMSLNKYFLNQMNWSARDVLDRSKILAEKVIEIWPSYHTILSGLI